MKTVSIIKNVITEYIVENYNISGLLWYHGGQEKITKFKNIPPINRRGNTTGFYFTSNKEIASGYGDIITTVKLLSQNPFILGKTNVSDKMLELYRKELNKEDPHLPIDGDWITTKSDYFKEKKQMPYTGLDGDAQQRIYKAGGFDSVIDGHEICVFDNDDIVVVG
jgi:hypothetical protein